ncbi:MULTISPECIES: cation diffusion facilitator family transporter [Methylophaga]|jgi:cobalt-zinc-cadmium efflux system protein|uniref:cation diffusion facilitator family transporter n=1 Tax=Methylophaga TaxID=40222 RepID=UPI000C8D3058|nr:MULTISPECIES: cation diffusion facilitator family transporter [Methylophaga]MAK65596.1 cation transporter [Methylophaga sp.]MAY16319.1 cation transporter [Methylophaga sp.]MCB2426107.1 cation diffusion facilitator family transporter [Methylophaga pinxianii]UPH47368.1 cation diffusion facilitator family transporter [Methylophaga pinxianii]|tara:strand:- start:41587 stop:42492 length:906 start_codon:yes stop_codon:yes gene_type:complete
MHTHHQEGGTSGNRIATAFFLNVSFTIIEFIGGWLTNSTAIMADAVHDLGDSLSIGSAWFLNRAGNKSADSVFTYGYRRLSLFGALINGLVLIAGSIWVLTQAVPRLADPVMPVTEGMLALALLGVTVNGFAAYRLSKGTSLNEKILNWHLLEDVLGWLAVLIISIILQFADWPILDPLLSIGFTLFILFNVVRNLWVTGKLFFQAVPDKALHDEIKKSLVSIEGVNEVHHLHLWSLDGEHHVLTAHLTLDNDIVSSENYMAMKQTVAEILSQYDLEHTTIELELNQERCRDFSDPETTSQ